jgi:hypothetical protein
MLVSKRSKRVGIIVSYIYRGDDYKDIETFLKCDVSRYKTNKDYLEEENGASVLIGKK